ncbi:NtaA/DmoA family FMN-dependent monooxygenase [Phytoactinopolyspora mesophila]|uniref:NtaA/DmoA family FMN-dependent monooxygenase n=1 Tax=Phytoactinopolyspora mesophila TaxID=2650750 RepID=A0A7K3LZP4_9ACTN|nr:NtaA/DmoA family FMN-dependent monooxygenase [Phytoactinopolyspora mesophila]NDL56494.1 NtaA/DmoA family FMN-dependent monooxygenase [Phytoactinopolyspora mesophila]
MVRQSNRQLALTMFMVGFGYHNDAWRHPRSRSGEIGTLELIRDMSQAAEAARLDAIFFADSFSAAGLRRGGFRGVSVYEPISTIGAMIGHTEKIGMIGTHSTTWGEPYAVARQFAGLDVLSGGRVGWNVVTSINGNENFGREQMPLPELRYARATEFVEVVKKLWDSWDADAIIDDKQRALWIDNDRIRDINHVGEYFRVQGPLAIPRSPQERPVLVQAGQSPAGIELGSSIADLVYTVQPDKAKAIEFYADYKQKVKAKGRDPEKVKILPGIMPITGRTQAEADELADELANCIDENNGRAMIQSLIDADVSDLDLNDKIPPDRFVDGPQRMERWYLFRELAERMSLWELIVHISRAVGHRVMISTPDKIAESMIEWFEDGACDGYNFNPPSVPEGMDNMLRLLVPELQERGYFRDEYVGDTFRERSGLTLTEQDLKNERATYVM